MAMEINNPKSKLKEYLQKRKLPPVKYSSNKIGGSDHKPIWSSTVILHSGESFTGEPCSNKIMAEMSCSEKILEFFLGDECPKKDLPLKECQSSESIVDIPSKVVLIDLENVPNFIKEGEDILKSYKVYAFVGENHDLAAKALPPWVDKIIVPSTRPNGVDTCMQVYTGVFLFLETFEIYIIATRDKFGSNLAEMIMAPNLAWKPKIAKHISRPSQIC